MSQSTQKSFDLNPLNNGRAGDAHEPDGVAAASFNPADFEARGTGAPPAAPDPFNPAALRLSEDLAAADGVKRALLTVPTRKPDKSWFVRVHPSEEYRLPTRVIELQDERGETYLVAPALWPELAGESTLVNRVLFTAVNRQGVVFLWPIKLPGSDGRTDAWSRSAKDAADLAMKGWVRVQANMSLGAYDVAYSTAHLPEPTWPDVPFSQLLRIAFRDRFITSMDHPVLRKLRGEV